MTKGLTTRFLMETEYKKYCKLLQWKDLDQLYQVKFNNCQCVSTLKILGEIFY